mmetsp:Transcript_8661/g.16651  ORF Transcript_8661/g.16651 Transcript_8661/m.16651 type:complete len:96 (-) Transcript_8661:208-495(-)
MTMTHESSLSRIPSMESISSAGSPPGSPVINSRPHTRRSMTVYHPVVSSMLFSNTLRDCSQVKDMLRHCMDNDGENSFMCQTATRYASFCDPRHK